MSLVMRPLALRADVPVNLPTPTGVKSMAAPAPLAPPARPPITETQLERLVKLIPADVAALYIPAIGFGSLTTWRYYALAVTIGATVLVPLLLWLDSRAANERVPYVQYIVRTLGFVAWAFVISQPLAPYTISPVAPALIALVLPVIGERLLR
jgi:hypothetical protein